MLPFKFDSATAMLGRSATDRQILTLAGPGNTLMLSSESVSQITQARQPPFQLAGGARTWTRPSWSWLAAWSPGLILVAFAAAAMIVPTGADVAVTDDWVYYRTVETFVKDHQLRVHEMSSAALVFQVFWGAAFASVFGLSFGVLRVSTLVMVAGSSLALYALCRELGVPREWSALGMAAYLFHPLTFALAFTFMTDPHFTALLIISAWCYVRGVRDPATSPRWLILGSVAAACASLVRQQGLLIPVCVAGVVFLQRRPTGAGQYIRLLVQIGGIPAVIAVVYGVWLRFVHGLPWALRLFADELQQSGWDGIATLGARLAVLEILYVGLFVLPFAALVLAVPWRRIARLSRIERLVAAAWVLLAVAGALTLGGQGRTMPYAPQFFHPTGLGPDDVIGGLPTLMGPNARVVLTAACVLVSSGFVVALARRKKRLFPWHMLIGLALGQALGALVPSVHFAVWDGTLDRYLLPLLPLAIVLLLGAARGGPRLASATACAVLLMGVFSVAGTRDYLTFLDTVWSVAREANALGIPNTRLDAGAGWDGFQIYEQPPTEAVPPRTPHAPWWIELFAPLTDSSYVVATVPLPGYAILTQRLYWSALHQQTETVYLLRQPGLPGPP